MGFSYTIQTPPLSMGNRRAYKVALTDIANDGTSIVYGLPFRKITGIMPEETATGTSGFKFVTAEATSRRGGGPTITLTSTAGTEDGEILVVGI